VNSPSRNAQRVMPLHSAAAGRHLTIMQALLAHGADPNARQADDFTPLHAAAQNGQIEMDRCCCWLTARMSTRKPMEKRLSLPQSSRNIKLQPICFGSTVRVV